jgi:hypothetical protein
MSTAESNHSPAFHFDDETNTYVTMLDCPPWGQKRFHFEAEGLEWEMNSQDNAATGKTEITLHPKVEAAHDKHNQTMITRFCEAWPGWWTNIKAELHETREEYGLEPLTSENVFAVTATPPGEGEGIESEDWMLCFEFDDSSGIFGVEVSEDGEITDIAVTF